MNRRLLQFLQAENITQAQLADTLSVARGSVSHILAGRNKPGYDFLESLLLHYPNLNMDWLMTGKGKMYRDAQPDPLQQPEGDDLFSAGSAAPYASSPAAPSPARVVVPQKPAREIDHITVFFTDSSFQEFYAKE